MILTSNGVEENAAPNRWNFKKAHLLSFHAEWLFGVPEEAVMSAEDPTGQFTGLLIQAARKRKKKKKKEKNKNKKQIN